MKKNRPKEENSFCEVEHKPHKSTPENIPVFLVLAVILLAVNFTAGYRHLLQKKVLSAPDEAATVKFVWFTGSPDHVAGLYQESPGQLKNQFPEINLLLSQQPADNINSLITAVKFDSDKPTIAALPPEVADVFFQPISINQADEDILASLPGIGPTLAEKIVSRRSRIGPFRSKEELLQVAGIGPKKFEALVEHITID